MRRALALLLLSLMGCSSSPPAPDWQLSASQSLSAFEQSYLVGNTAAAEAEFARARSELARTGREDLVARAELVRCAVRTASLQFDDCPGFEALRAGASADEVAYARYLAGKGGYKTGEEPLSRLVAAGIKLKTGAIDPVTIAQAVDVASTQGWRRPLLAWLGVQAKRAEDAGDRETAAGIRRRMALISG